MKLRRSKRVFEISVRLFRLGMQRCLDLFQQMRRKLFNYSRHVRSADMTFQFTEQTTQPPFWEKDIIILMGSEGGKSAGHGTPVSTRWCAGADCSPLWGGNGANRSVGGQGVAGPASPSVFITTGCQITDLPLGEMLRYSCSLPGFGNLFQQFAAFCKGLVIVPSQNCVGIFFFLVCDCCSLQHVLIINILNLNPLCHGV